jgi:alpha-galactosidase
MNDRIEFIDNRLYICFQIRDDGIVELSKFVPISAPVKKALKEQHEKKSEQGKSIFPVVEINVTGKSTRGMHGYKHNSGSASLDFRYKNHTVKERPDGKELIITLKTEHDVYAYYHLVIFKDVPVVQAYTEIENKGTLSWPIEYVSSFIYQNLCGEGAIPYYDKTDVYLPFNSWSCEARWKKEDLADLNVSGMTSGYNLPGFGNNRFAYTGHSSWSSNEYLPMGICHDRENNYSYVFEVESSGQWHIEYDTEIDERLTIALSGATEQEHGWWLDLKPGVKFTTVPAAFGVVEGGVSEAISALTQYRRRIRRPNEDDSKCNVVFNDYMNCLFGDPTEEKEKPIIDKAAALGCEYYCMDCGWYDKGYWWDRVGEWIESPERFPNGVKALSDYVRSKGMVMGLWLEIEVMGTECELAKKLPDNWFICRHGKRHVDNKRYMLDFRNPEVYDYCMKVVDRLVNDYGIGYFKVDYNVTQGIGSDIDTDSCAGAMLDHYRALYHWYEEIFRKYPNLVIENCGSGAQRMDYGMLRLLSLQSTSDQTDYIHNAYIASNVATAVTPEQAGMWVYPYEDDSEHVIFNMVNGLLLRPYVSGMVWKLSERSMSLLHEGITLYKRIRNDVKEGIPYWPLGFNMLHDDVLAYGLNCNNKAYLSVFAIKSDTAEIPLNFTGKKITSVNVIYPASVSCDFNYDNKTLKIHMPQAKAARLFEIQFE